MKRGNIMILFVSGRCDIPAFFSRWFFNRLFAGYVDVRNPYDSHQISRIILNQTNIDAIIFCTKNPIPMLNRLDEIPFPHLFHITITPYHQDIEPYVVNKKEIIHAVKYISKSIGKDRVVIRYDPILLNKTYTIDYHEKAFQKLCEQVSPFIHKIIISFVDMYKNTMENMKYMQLHSLSHKEMHELGKRLGNIAYTYGIKIETCAESCDLREYGIVQGRCIDKKEMENLIGYEIPFKKGVRSQCSCIETVDIGDYNCCHHSCKYCYANYDEKQVKERIQLHDPNSSVLLGHLTKKDRITVRKEKSFRQITLL